MHRVALRRNSDAFVPEVSWVFKFPTRGRISGLFFRGAHNSTPCESRRGKAVFQVSASQFRHSGDGLVRHPSLPIHQLKLARTEGQQWNHLPFPLHSGVAHSGGKVDDITAVVALICKA